MPQKAPAQPPSPPQPSHSPHTLNCLGISPDSNNISKPMGAGLVFLGDFGKVSSGTADCNVLRKSRAHRLTAPPSSHVARMTGRESSDVAQAAHAGIHIGRSRCPAYQQRSPGSEQNPLLPLQQSPHTGTRRRMSSTRPVCLLDRPLAGRSIFWLEDVRLPFASAFGAFLSCHPIFSPGGLRVPLLP